MRIFYIYIIFVAYFLLFTFGCKQNSTTSEKSIKIGMLPADAPFMSLNKQGKSEGFDVDIAYKIGEILNRNIEIIELEMSELFIALECKKIDAMMCGLSITHARNELYNMVHYQGSGVKTFPLVFWEKAPAYVQTMEDLQIHFQNRKIVIAVLSGTLQESYAQQFDFITTKAMNNYADIILDLQYHKVDAALFDEAIQSYIKQRKEIKVINVPLGNFESLGHGIAFHKINTELAHEFAHAVALLKKNGTIRLLEQLWHLNGESNE